MDAIVQGARREHKTDGTNTLHFKVKVKWYPLPGAGFLMLPDVIALAGTSQDLGFRKDFKRRAVKMYVVRKARTALAKPRWRDNAGLFPEENLENKLTLPVFVSC